MFSYSMNHFYIYLYIYFFFFKKALFQSSQEPLEWQPTDDQLRFKHTLGPHFEDLEVVQGEVRARFKTEATFTECMKIVHEEAHYIM